MKIVGNRIKEFRKQAKLSQNELGKLINTDQTSISGYEIGKTSPPLEILLDLATIFNTTVAYLIGETDDPTRRPEQANININEITMINDIDTAKRFLLEITGYTKIKDLPDDDLILTANVFLSYLKKVKG